jgi:uncharacterized membrane protein
MLVPIRTCDAARRVFVIVWGLLSLATVAAPYLASHSHPVMAAILYMFFSPVCHQNPTRSFALAGCKWAVCQRCSGIYWGILLLSLLPVASTGMMGTVRRRRIVVIGATMPLLLDSLLPVAGIWTNVPWSRFMSGMLFGAMISTLLLPGITQLFREAQWQRLRSRRSFSNGATLWTRKEC